MPASLGLSLLSSVLTLIGTAEGLTRHEFAETHMGSTFKIVLYSPSEPDARRASRAAFARIAELDRAFSDYQPESELSRLCATAGDVPFPVSDDLFDILQRSRSMYERSGGAFDVTVGPVVRLWRRARRDRKMPSAENLARARALVSSRLLSLDARQKSVRLARSGMKLDLGGIAKGYASEEALKVLRRLGVPRALVAGAGDIVVGDPPPDRDGWTVAIAPLDPSSSAPVVSLSLQNVAISTSGDTERFVEIDGKRFSHIVDPRTGLGIVDRCSVTVVAADGATADALDTAVYVLGPERGLPLVESTPGAAALIVRKSAAGVETYTSRRFPDIPRAPKVTETTSGASPVPR
ncbi:MAG: FAD:protein FMN transferase [Isosphaeraceae bacterium]